MQSLEDNVENEGDSGSGGRYAHDNFKILFGLWSQFVSSEHIHS